jgi:hypothetical protein
LTSELRYREEALADDAIQGCITSLALDGFA